MVEDKFDEGVQLYRGSLKVPCEVADRIDAAINGARMEIQKIKEVTDNLPSARVGCLSFECNGATKNLEEITVYIRNGYLCCPRLKTNFEYIFEGPDGNVISEYLGFRCYCGNQEIPILKPKDFEANLLFECRREFPGDD